MTLEELEKFPHSTNAFVANLVKPVGRDEEGKVVWQNVGYTWAVCKYHKNKGLSEREKAWREKKN